MYVKVLILSKLHYTEEKLSNIQLYTFKLISFNIYIVLSNSVS